MGLTKNEIVNILKNKIFLSSEEFDSIVFDVDRQNCDHLEGYKSEDIHFHRFEMICLNCNRAIGFYDQYSQRKFYYKTERELDESTRNLSHKKTPKEYEVKT